MSKDYYEILEVEKEASKDEIKKAYKKLARKYHPDVSKETDAEQKFKEINEAAGVLLDDQKRQQYDQFGSADGHQGFGGGFGGRGFNPQDFGINIDDIFEQFGFGGFSGFGGGRGQGRQRKDTREYIEVEISLSDAYFGVEKTLKISRDEKCEQCGGKGAESSKDIEICSTCSGSGVVIEMQRSILGAIKTQRPCHNCGGRGETIKNSCNACDGKGSVSEKENFNIKIPKGIENTVTLRVPEKGSFDKDSQEYGDLYVKVYIKKDKTFDVEGSDLYMNLDINFVQAILGDEIEFEHFDKTLSLKIPEGTQSATILRLKNKGMPHFNYQGHGDLYVKVNVEIPKKTTKEQKKILMDYAKTLKDKNLFSRLKNLFN